MSFSEGLSIQDEMLLSSNDDIILFTFKNKILITKNGFYPKDKIKIIGSMEKNDEEYDSYYADKFVDFLEIKKFNFNRFVSDIKKNNLQDLRLKLLPLLKQYPQFIKSYNNYCKDKEKDKIFVTNTYNFTEINKVLSDTLSNSNQLEKKFNREYDYSKLNDCYDYCKQNYCSTARNEPDPQPSYSNSSGSYSSSSGGCELEVYTTYLPGTNRMVQTTRCK